ncbi:MAG: SDR family oxidoreductase [Pseudomonadota bacterium]
MVSLKSLPQDYRAVVAGSSGGLGSAVLEHLKNDPRCSEVTGLSRSSTPSIDLTDEAMIAEAAAHIGKPLHLFFDATGFLSDEIIRPEKSLKTIDPNTMAKLLELNAIGPMLLMKHFCPLMPRSERAIFATLSARVGSIGDNRLGGWYAYRASKAALNQLIRCTAIELARTHRNSMCIALHPGTVATSLSDPFASERDRLSPQKSAAMMLDVLDHLSADQTGTFWDYGGNSIEW